MHLILLCSSIFKLEPHLFICHVYSFLLVPAYTILLHSLQPAELLGGKLSYYSIFPPLRRIFRIKGLLTSLICSSHFKVRTTFSERTSKPESKKSVLRHKRLEHTRHFPHHLELHQDSLSGEAGKLLVPDPHQQWPTQWGCCIKGRNLLKPELME